LTPRLDRACFRQLNLTSDEALSDFAFYFSLRRYGGEDDAEARDGAARSAADVRLRELCVKLRKAGPGQKNVARHV